MKFADCHPDRKHYAKGLCEACYSAKRWRATPFPRRSGLPKGPRPRPSMVRLPDSLGAVGYLAGIIDGEGNLSFDRRSDGSASCWRVSVANTNREMMDWLCAIGGRATERFVSRDDGYTRKPIYLWRVSNARSVREILVAVLPYLIEKRARAMQAIADIDAWLERHRM